jgi:hypothetical protein
MAHATNILLALQEFKCTVCGEPIGKEEAGTRVHLRCLDGEREQK